MIILNVANVFTKLNPSSGIWNRPTDKRRAKKIVFIIFAIIIIIIIIIIITSIIVIVIVVVNSKYPDLPLLNKA